MYLLDLMRTMKKERKSKRRRSQGCRKESSEMRSEIRLWNGWVTLAFEVMTIYHAWWLFALLFFFIFFADFFPSASRSHLSFAYTYATASPTASEMMRTFSNLFYYNIIKQNTFEWCLISVLLFPFFGAIRFGTSAAEEKKVLSSEDERA